MGRGLPVGGKQISAKKYRMPCTQQPDKTVAGFIICSAQTVMKAVDERHQEKIKNLPLHVGNPYLRPMLRYLP